MSDIDFDQDDFFEDYEDEAEDQESPEEEKAKNDEPVREVLSPEEQDRRVAEFQKLQKKNMHISVKPKQFKPEQRKEAIRWLGEAGDPTSVPALLKVYQKDKTPGMKDEAAYALGQIKAMGRALEDPEMDEKAYDLLNNIVLYNEFGKRVDTKRFQMIEIGLGISAAVLFFIGIIAMIAIAMPRNQANAEIAAETSAYETLIAPTATDDAPEIVEAELEAYYGQLLEDATNYQFQILAAGRGESIVCEEGFFNKSPHYTLTTKWAGNPTYTPVVDALNTIRDTLGTVRDAYEQSCNTATAITREEALSLGTSILDAQNLLREAEQLLAGSGLEAPTVEFASPTPPPTDIPEPTATPDLSLADDVIIQIERIITDMTGPRGTSTSVVFWWEQVISSNQMYREGCNLGSVTIPADYVLPVELQGAFPELDRAVQSVNVGLLTLRESSTAFFAACTAGSVPDKAAEHLAQANLAKSAFTSAQVELDTLQGN